MKKLIPVLLGFAIALPCLAQEKGKWDINKLDPSKLPAPAAKSPVTFDADIKPLFKNSCVHCHGEDEAKGGLRLDSLDATLKGGKAGRMLVAGNSAKSLLVLAISQQDPRTSMPPRPRNRPNGAKPAHPSKPLTAEQVALVRAWIDQGAK